MVTVRYNWEVLENTLTPLGTQNHSKPRSTFVRLLCGHPEWSLFSTLETMVTRAAAEGQS